MAYQKEMMRKEIGEQVAKYNKECKYLGSHIGTPSEISDMLKKAKDRSCSHT